MKNFIVIFTRKSEPYDDVTSCVTADTADNAIDKAREEDELQSGEFDMDSVFVETRARRPHNV